MSDSATFTIFGTLPGLNEYTDANRRHARAGARLKRSAEDIVATYAKAARLPAFDCSVTVSFSWHEPDRRRDLDNVAFAKKFILDALVKVGVLQDDGRKYVTGFSDAFHVDRRNPRVVVTIERTPV